MAPLTEDCCARPVFRRRESSSLRSPRSRESFAAKTFSFTPGFSPVTKAGVARKPFQRFSSVRCVSAEGAEYESQGQAPNNVRRVAPGNPEQSPLSSERAEESTLIFRTFSARCTIIFRNQGRRASRLPLAFICRAFGADEDRE